MKPKSKSQRIKYLSVEQQQELLNAIIDRRDKLIIRLLIDTGMRIGEFTLMKVENILKEESYINIPEENTKTKTARTVRINKEIMNDLISYMKDGGIKDGYIWRGNKRASHITPRAMQQMIKKYGTMVNLAWLTPHKFRHTHIVRALERGVPVNAVQQQVGHAEITTTQIYSRLAPREIKNSYERAGL